MIPFAIQVLILILRDIPFFFMEFVFYIMAEAKPRALSLSSEIEDISKHPNWSTIFLRRFIIFVMLAMTGRASRFSWLAVGPSVIISTAVLFGLTWSSYVTCILRFVDVMYHLLENIGDATQNEVLVVMNSAINCTRPPHEAWRSTFNTTNNYDCIFIRNSPHTLRVPVYEKPTETPIDKAMIENIILKHSVFNNYRCVYFSIANISNCMRIIVKLPVLALAWPLRIWLVLSETFEFSREISMLPKDHVILFPDEEVSGLSSTQLYRIELCAAILDNLSFQLSNGGGDALQLLNTLSEIVDSNRSAMVSMSTLQMEPRVTISFSNYSAYIDPDPWLHAFDEFLLEYDRSCFNLNFKSLLSSVYSLRRGCILNALNTIHVSPPSLGITDIVVRRINLDDVSNPENLHDNYNGTLCKRRQDVAQDMFSCSSECSDVDYFISYKWSDNRHLKSEKIIMHFFGHIYDSRVIILSTAGAFTAAPFAYVSFVLTLNRWALICPFLIMSVGFGMVLWLRLFLMAPCLARIYSPWKKLPVTFWLDKCCIDQNQEQAFIANYSQHFSYLQSRCSKMLVLFSPKYTRSLWCTYELMSWCKEKRRTSSRCRICVEQTLLPASGEYDMHVQKEIVNPVEGLTVLNLSWPSYLAVLIMNSSHGLSNYEKWICGTFSVSKARCGKPSDRVFIVNEIRSKWGSVSAFEEFLRKELPVALLAAKQQYYNEAFSAFQKNFALLFLSPFKPSGKKRWIHTRRRHEDEIATRKFKWMVKPVQLCDPSQ